VAIIILLALITVYTFLPLTGHRGIVESLHGGSQRQIAVTARSVFCYLGSREFGLTGRQLSRAIGLTPAAIHYAIVRGENFLREDKEVEEGLNKYLNNLTLSP
jgi:hypothetical protein